MDCQEAQSKVLNYLNHKLNREETKEFIEHIRKCQDCQDELEINYIVMVGMRQLDGGEVFSADFRKGLKEDMDSRYAQAQKEEERNRSLRVAVLALLVSLLLWFLGRGIALLL